MRHSLSVGPLAGVLHEMEYRLLARVLQVMGFARDTCNLVPQSHSSKKVNLFGQYIATLLAL